MQQQPSTQAASRPLLRGGIAALCLVLGAGLGSAIGWRAAMHRSAAQRTLPVLFNAPTYRDLRNQNGDKVSSQAFDGKVQVVAFLFPYCNTFCPVIAAHLVGFENLLASSGLADKVDVVSFNVDPGGTGPRQMREFLQEYGWDASNPHWQYLTGTPAQIRSVVTSGFHVDYQKVMDQGSSGDSSSSALAVAGSDPQPQVVNPLATKADVPYDITHEDVLMLVDQHGRVRAIYDQADAVGKFALLKAVRSLLGRAG